LREVGQARLRKARVAVVGVGGLGTHVVQQLALLGVGVLLLIDDEVLSDTNLNRYVGVGPGDIGQPKVKLGERLARSIDPSIEVVPIHAGLLTKVAFDAVKGADFVFGTVDNEGSRLVLTELCAAYARPYIDAASDVIPAKDGSAPEPRAVRTHARGHDRPRLLCPPLAAGGSGVADHPDDPAACVRRL
jgi:molybdopterin/thiamine biosynthesis adenylyltransferase